MQKVKDISNSTATLDRLLGAETNILGRQTLFINKFVSAEFLSVNAIDHLFSEDDGRIFLYPIEDGLFNLQLFYLIGENISSLEILRLEFLPEFFEMFPSELLSKNAPFKFDRTTEQQFNVCNPSKVLIGQLKELTSINPLVESIQQTEIAIALLHRAIESISLPFAACAVPACRFLAYESEREKIIAAQKIMMETIDQPLSIKELSRKVAMNECYLKKGFKTIFGKTINEYQQSLRINKAKDLLQHQGQTVTEVATTLGYSSISHFSTAFKKATGLKPCELLG